MDIMVYIGYFFGFFFGLIGGWLSPDVRDFVFNKLRGKKDERKV